MSERAASLRRRLNPRTRRRGQIGPTLEASRALQGFRPQKVSPAGQLTLPAAARTDLQVRPRGFVDVVQVGTAIVVKRSFDRFGYTDGARIRQPRCSPILRAGQRYKVSQIGQLSLPAAARRAWGIEKGGWVEVAAVQGAVVILPLGGPAKLLREWVGDDEVNDGSQGILAISRASKGATRPDPPAARQMLLTDSLLWNLLGGKPLPSALRDTPLVVPLTECVSFTQEAVRKLEDASPPPQLKLLVESTGKRIDFHQWQVLLLDFRRVEAANQMVTIDAPETTLIAEAAVTAQRWDISVRLATDLLIVRDHGGALCMPKGSESLHPPAQAILANLGLKMTTLFNEAEPHAED